MMGEDGKKLLVRLIESKIDVLNGLFDEAKEAGIAVRCSIGGVKHDANHINLLSCKSMMTYYDHDKDKKEA